MKNFNSETGKKTVGLDLGDRWSHWCELDSEGGVLERGRVQTEAKALQKLFEGRSSARIAMENGTHSRWVKRVLEAYGHEVVVANTRKVRLIYGDGRKTDRLDAEKLARLARVDVSLLSPIRYRQEQAHADWAVLKARDGLVKARTQLINQVRGMVKTFGARLPAHSGASFARKVGGMIPERLKGALAPLLQVVEDLTVKIGAYDRTVEELSQHYPETRALRQVSGVGPLTSLAYVLVVEDARRFRRSRQVGPYLGLVPRLDQSGAQDKQLRISKAGNDFLRRLLVSSAHYILGPFGPDSDLRRYGGKIASGGGKNAKKRAVVAVARKLSVVLHHLWVSGEVYDPLYNQKRLTSFCA